MYIFWVLINHLIPPVGSDHLKYLQILTLETLLFFKMSLYYSLTNTTI